MSSTLWQDLSRRNMNQLPPWTCGRDSHKLALVVPGIVDTRATAISGGLCRKLLSDLAKRGRGFGALISRHQLRMSVDLKVRQLGTKGATTVIEIGFEVDYAIGGDRIGD